MKLQGKWQDIIQAYNSITEVKDTLVDARSKAEFFHSKWFEESRLLASKVNVEPSLPRVTCHQNQRANTPANNTSVEYYGEC